MRILDRLRAHPEPETDLEQLLRASLAMTPSERRQIGAVAAAERARLGHVNHGHEWEDHREPVVEAVIFAGGQRVVVVGESHYRSEIAGVCGGTGPSGVHAHFTAVLRPEPTNPYDRWAVRVEIREVLVGYLPADAARVFQPVTKRLVKLNRTASCDAIVCGGWDNGRGNWGEFGVTLDLATPKDLLAAIGR